MSVSGINERRAQEAEREAQNRITAATKNAEETERAYAKRLDELKDEFVKQYETEGERQEAAIEAERTKGYERLNQVKRGQDTEFHRIRRDGEKDVDALREHYRNTTYDLVRKGDQELREAESQQFRRSEFEQKSAATELDFAKEEHGKRMRSVISEQDKAISELKDQSRAEFERQRSNVEGQREVANAEFEQRFKNTLGEQETTLREIQARSAGKLNELRADNEAKLTAYDERRADPFYRLTTVDADLSETDDAYVLTARIPPHEQDHVSVAVRGNQVVISGHRKNEEKLELEPGRTQSSSAFQSFQESFPVAWPIDGKGMTREVDGDRLTITLPKRKTYAPPPQYKAAPRRASAERPQFPDNLKIPTAKPLADEGTPRPKPGGKGTGTLS
jgi:HSP20 family molecular chaperone IbpA